MRSTRLKFYKAIACGALLTLVTACSPTLTTRTAETDRAVAAGVCSVWLPVTYSSRDTDQTQDEVRANNAARDAYCLD